MPYGPGCSQAQFGPAPARSCSSEVFVDVSSLFHAGSSSESFDGGTPVSWISRGWRVHASVLVVVSTSFKLQPVMVAQASATDVAVVLVISPMTVVANTLWVKQRAASTGVQSVGFGAGSILPPG